MLLECPCRNFLFGCNAMRRAATLLASATLALSMFVATARAVTTNWAVNGGGSYTTAGNWSAGVPGSADTAGFNRNADITYAILFPGRPIASPLTRQVDHLSVGTNTVSFSDSVNLNQLPAALAVVPVIDTGEHALRVGDSFGQTAVLNTTLSSFSSTSVTMGKDTITSGTLRITGGTFNVTGTQSGKDELIVGDLGAGTLEVSSGGHLTLDTNSNAVIGRGASSTGTVNVSGVGSTWTDGALAVQRGSLNVTLGGVISTSSASISGNSPVVTIDGDGSTWTNAAPVTIGNGGLLKIQNAGQVAFPTATIGAVSPLSTAATVEVDGAGSTWNISSSLSIGVGDSTLGSVTVRNGAHASTGSATIGRFFTLDPIKHSSASVVVEGAGSLWSINGGLSWGIIGTNTLCVRDGGRVEVSGGITLLSTGVLSGNGTLAGNLTSTGTVSPGSSAGALHIEGSYSQTVSGPFTGQLNIELGGPTPGSGYDQLLVSGPVTLDGFLIVSLINGFPPAAGQTFDILDWGSVSGAFQSISLPSLSPGLAWNRSQLYTTGTLKVGYEGDFDLDGDVDGADLLVWQRGGSPTPNSASDLAAWKATFGLPVATATTAAVPEPTNLSAGILAVVTLLRRPIAPGVNLNGHKTC